MPKTKIPSIDKQWQYFERWEEKFIKAAARAERRRGNSRPGEDLFLAAPWEEDWTIDMEGISKRAAEKIDFLRAYLRDISFDGPEFMAQCSSFLDLQFPSACEDVYSFLIMQDIEQEIPIPDFSGYWMRIFLKELTDIDFSSAFSVMPFHDIQITKPKNQTWTSKQIQSAIRTIKHDLGFDGFDCHVRTTWKTKTSINLKFIWDT